MEVILRFCDIIKISVDQLLELKVSQSANTNIRTFAELLSIIIDLDRRGLNIKGNTTYSQQDTQLTAHLSLDIANAQLATFIPDWNKMNLRLKEGTIDEDEYRMWLEDTLKIFNVPIDDYLT